MRIRVVSIPVLDQAKALQFYTEKLGMVKNKDIPVSADSRWLTVVSPEEPDGPEILLEPAPLHFEPSKVFQKELYDAGIPWTQLEVDSVQAEYDRLVALDVTFKMKPTDAGPVRIAILDDTCGNYIQLLEML